VKEKTMADAFSGIEEVFRLVDREIWIVTASDGKARGGLCATWVSQSSLDPQKPVVLLGIAPNHFTRELIDRSGRCGLHLLRPDQTEIALRFAIGSGREKDKLAGLATSESLSEPPRLRDALAWLECQILSHYDGGDRIYYWADVVAGSIATTSSGMGPPLREKGLLAAATQDQRRLLKENRQFDIELHRPLHQAWRDQAPK
jgi:flavin reductase (DIM6/NTAB) family NADH-FMN oxidoreductase RutF